MLPLRWQPLLDFFEVLHAPLREARAGRWFAIETSGPDGAKWTSHQRVYVDLSRPNPPLDAVRAVATLCGATAAAPDPGPLGQEWRGIYYAPTSLDRRWREDSGSAALGAILLDIDDRDHGGRDGTLRALATVPRPTAVVRSGGGVQAAFVLREAVVFDRRDEDGLAASIRTYLRVAVALERLTDADETWWPSHLFRCPATYHLKQPSRPLLVAVDLDPARCFNLSDFDDVTSSVEDVDLATYAEGLVDRFMGRPRRARAVPVLAPLPATPRGPGEKPRVTLPRRVSEATVRLLNTGHHPKYERRNGSLDRSRAVEAVACSLMAAGLGDERIVSVIANSALRAALDDRGDDAMRWLGFQIQAARVYLTKKGTRRDRP